ncbi:hypothetical protein COOONC_06075 [Cooperia oncophora]
MGVVFQIERALPQKTKGALLLMSHCSTVSSRESIIQRLSTKVDITVGGRCSRYFPAAEKARCPKSMKGGQCEKDLIATHRFYIAFENSICRNYITEKFFKRISQLLVPIVLERKFYEDNGIPSDSFIALDDFKNDDGLAAYLDMVQHNDTEYLRYFEWTNYYRKPSTYVSDAGCRLCQDLHQGKRRHVDNIETFYFDEQCEENYYYLISSGSTTCSNGTKHVSLLEARSFAGEVSRLERANRLVWCRFGKNISFRDEYNFHVLFVLGMSGIKTDDDSVHREAKEHGDILQLNINETDGSPTMKHDNPDPSSLGIQKGNT